MFNRKKTYHLSVLRLEDDVDVLKQRIESLSYVGEAYLSWTYAPMGGICFADKNVYPNKKWCKFLPQDITERCPEGSVKIKGVWCKPSHFFLYDDKYQSIRKLKEKQFTKGE